MKSTEAARRKGMTKRQMERDVANTGCTVTEKIGRAIDIEIEAPDGKHFSGGPHVLVTHWFSDFEEARLSAVRDLVQNLPLVDCPADCECTA